MRYISDLRIGRINPKHFQFGLDVEHKKLNPPSFLRKLISEQTSLEARLAGIEPPFAQYKATRQALLRYMELAKEDDGEKLPGPPGILFIGGPYEGISRLVSRLRLIGDLPQDAVIPADSKIYDGPLVDAVKRFQERHGLTPNGYLTVDTGGALSIRGWEGFRFPGSAGREQRMQRPGLWPTPTRGSAKDSLPPSRPN
jgi:L,D-transpeptidase YcbB